MILCFLCLCLFLFLYDSFDIFFSTHDFPYISEFLCKFDTFQMVIFVLDNPAQKSICLKFELYSILIVCFYDYIFGSFYRTEKISICDTSTSFIHDALYLRFPNDSRIDIHS